MAHTAITAETSPSVTMPWRSLGSGVLAIMVTPLVLVLVVGLTMSLSIGSYGLFNLVLPETVHASQTGRCSIAQMAAIIICAGSFVGGLVMSGQMAGGVRKLLALPAFATGYCILLTLAFGSALGVASAIGVEGIGLIVVMVVVMITAMVASLFFAREINIAQGGTGIG